mmetsp:Transcript_82925/g.222448  ORF Transcript_82925/g.222448 Transcript_82925/m.222448 type:complete len:130 (-) Transcript_82925:513-902(-)
MDTVQFDSSQSSMQSISSCCSAASKSVLQDVTTVDIKGKGGRRSSITMAQERFPHLDLDHGKSAEDELELQKPSRPMFCANVGESSLFERCASAPARPTGDWHSDLLGAYDILNAMSIVDRGAFSNIEY